MWRLSGICLKTAAGSSGTTRRHDLPGEIRHQFVAIICLQPLRALLKKTVLKELARRQF
jgi:hypothetical protein